MLSFWYKEFPQYPKDHKDYWRTRLIAHSLLICCSYFFVLTVLNIAYFKSYDIALLDAFGLLASLAVTLWFNKTGLVHQTAWLIALIIVGLIMAFIISVNAQAHSLFWATLIPPFTFFLLGRNWGSVLSLGAFAICAYLIYSQQHQAVTIGLGSLLNIIEVAIAHVLLFRFYEKTRSSAYSRLSKRNQEIKLLAETDKLTGLANRQKFDAELSQQLIKNKQQSHTASTILMICDIDHFKKINDRHGHLAGDKVLSEFANILQQKLGDNISVARWGGEEFTIILANSTIDDAINEAEALRAYIAQHLIDNRQLTISIGLAKADINDTVLTLLERADKALYQAKMQGRDQIRVANVDLLHQDSTHNFQQPASIP
jgi:two-component system, cell cycle response regulator